MTGCAIHLYHSPRPQVAHRHHIVPKSWGGPDTGDNIIVLCPTSHENVHSLLNEYVRAKDVPSWETLRNYGVAERDLAVRAWRERPSGPLPYTSAGGTL